MELPVLLQPETQTPERKRGDVRANSIERSNLSLRAGVGMLGIALPVLLLLGDWFFVNGSPSARGSLSAYYYSGMRDVFVGILFAIAPLLFTYKLFKRNLDNTLSILGGIAALGVAIFPTGRPSGSAAALTPLQERFGEDPVAIVHHACAAVLIGCLMIVSWSFADREGKRPQERVGHDAHFSPRFWKLFHRSTSVAIVLAVVFIIVAEFFDLFDGYALLIGELVICFAFGASWLTKGWEFDVLRGASTELSFAEAPPGAEPAPVAGD